MAAFSGKSDELALHSLTFPREAAETAEAVEAKKSSAASRE
jgi:hypothetical protein